MASSSARHRRRFAEPGPASGAVESLAPWLVCDCADQPQTDSTPGTDPVAAVVAEQLLVVERAWLLSPEPDRATARLCGGHRRPAGCATPFAQTLSPRRLLSGDPCRDEYRSVAVPAWTAVRAVEPRAKSLKGPRHGDQTIIKTHQWLALSQLAGRPSPTAR